MINAFHLKIISWWNKYQLIPWFIRNWIKPYMYVLKWTQNIMKQHELLCTVLIFQIVHCNNWNLVNIVGYFSGRYLWSAKFTFPIKRELVCDVVWVIRSDTVINLMTWRRRSRTRRVNAACSCAIYFFLIPILARNSEANSIEYFHKNQINWTSLFRFIRT